MEDRIYDKKKGEELEARDFKRMRRKFLHQNMKAKKHYCENVLKRSCVSCDVICDFKYKFQRMKKLEL